MATSSFKNASVENVTNSATDVFDAPATAGHEYIIFSMIISNIISATAKIDLTLTDSSAGTTINLLEDVPIAEGSTLVFDKPIVLEPSDALDAVADTANAFDIHISYVDRDSS